MFHKVLLIAVFSGFMPCRIWPSGGICAWRQRFWKALGRCCKPHDCECPLATTPMCGR